MGFYANETPNVYNSQKSGYLAKCWSLTQTQDNPSQSFGGVDIFEVCPIPVPVPSSSVKWKASVTFVVLCSWE